MVLKFVKPNGDVLSVGDEYDWRLQKNGLSGFGSFEGKLSTTDDYSRDGEHIDNIRLGGKNRTIKICNIDWRNSLLKREQAKRFFSYQTTYKIYVKHGSDTLWGNGKLYRMSMNEPSEEDDYMLKITMSFEFENPYLMSVDDFGRDIASLVPGFGFPWMSKIGVGRPVGVFNFERSVVLTNNGDNIAYPVIKIKFYNDVLNPVVSINSGFIKINGTFGANDSIEINYTKNPPTVTNNGNNILGMCDRSSDFDNMYILVGENTISFDADNGTDEMSVSVYYNRLYTLI